MKFTIGCDPEIFFLNNNNKPISSIGLIGGTKHAPRPIDDKGHAILEDNVAVEFNIAPAHNHHAFLESIRMTMAHIQQIVGGELHFSQDASLQFPDDQLQHPDALEFGCDPDFNVWTRSMNPRPECQDRSLRSAGGHVHIGTELPMEEVVKAMDLHLGVPSVVLDASEASVRRRQLYGKAGCFRPKPYGVEYRTLSNFWIFKDSLIAWVYEQTERALDFVHSGKEISEYEGELIQAAINKGDEGAFNYLKGRFAL